MHFNQHVIEPTQGGAIAGVKEGGAPVLLFLDGHASRSSPVAHQHIQLLVTVEVEHLRVQTIRR